MTPDPYAYPVPKTATMHFFPPDDERSGSYWSVQIGRRWHGECNDACFEVGLIRKDSQ